MTVLKTSIPKGNPRQITYRDYKKFDSLKFNNELKNVLTIENIDNCTKYDEKILDVLDKHAPLKKSYCGQIMHHMFLRLYTKSNNEEILPRKSVL